MVKRDDWPIAADEAFELWLKLKVKDLRTLQRQIEHHHKVKIPLSVISRWAEHGEWVQRGFRIAMMMDAEVNQAAFETIKGRLVRRRADSMTVVGEIFDEMLRNTALLAKNDQLKTFYTGKNASPKVLIDSLNALEKLGRLYQSLLPPTRHGEDGEEEPVEEVVEGFIDPLQLAEQLTVLANRPRLKDLTAAAEKEAGNDTR